MTQLGSSADKFITKIYSYNGIFSVMKGNKVWINIIKNKNILSERSQPQKATYYLVSLIWNY